MISIICSFRMRKIFLGRGLLTEHTKHIPLIMEKIDLDYFYEIKK